MTGRWPMLRILLTAHVSFVVVVWLVLLVGAEALTFILSTWWDVDRSVWQYVATQVPRWVALGLGIDAIRAYLRLHVAHGGTRRDFLRQLWPYLVGLATSFALLVTIGYLVERTVYALAGWPQHIAYWTLFGDAGNILGILGAFTLTLLMWAVAGVLLAVAFTRNFVLGLLTIPLGLALVAPSEALVGLNGVPMFTELLEELDYPALVGVALSPVGISVGCAVIWGTVRDMPVRPRVT